MRCSDNVRRRRKGVNFGEGGAAFGIAAVPSVNILGGHLLGLGRSDVVGVVMGVWIRFARRVLAVALAALVGSFWRTVIVRRTNQADGSVPRWADEDTWEVRLEAGHLVVERQMANPNELESVRVLEDDRELAVSDDVRMRQQQREMDEAGASAFGRAARPGGVFYDRDGNECQDLLIRNGTWESQRDPIVPRYAPYTRQFDRFTRPGPWRLHVVSDKVGSADFEPTWGWWVYSSGTRSQRDTWRVGMFAPSGVVFVLVGSCAASWYRRRPRRGHCRACGYDLRASPERCPECGRVNVHGQDAHAT